jgi:hypothetical protein
MGNEFFDGLGETITRTAKELSERAEGIYEAQKLRNRISGEERIVNKVKADLGNLIYSRYLNGESVDSEISVLCEEITQHVKKISELKDEAASKKGQKICPACQKAVDKEVSFCPYCGAACPDQPKEEENFAEASEEPEDCGPQEEAGEEDGTGDTPQEAGQSQDDAVEEEASETVESEASAEEEIEI